MARRAAAAAAATETDPITGQKTDGVSTIETKEFFRTSEFWTMLVINVTIAITAVADEAFDAPGAMRWIAVVTAAYIVSRGIAKAGSSHVFWGRDKLPFQRGGAQGSSDYSTLEARLNRLERGQR